ncbi:hypothetical protein ACVWY3_001447 [Bradyrhizobium sp. USDA 4486]
MFTVGNQRHEMRQLPPIAAKGVKCINFWLIFAIYQQTCSHYPRYCPKFLRKSFLPEYACRRPGRPIRAVGLAVGRHLLQK